MSPTTTSQPRNLSVATEALDRVASRSACLQGRHRWVLGARPVCLLPQSTARPYQTTRTRTFCVPPSVMGPC
eukprot:9541344-Lingulodinium_polyedra.AAC.1